MRKNISCDVGVADRERLLALVADRNTPAEVVEAGQDHPRHRRWARHHGDHPGAKLNHGM
jgi:hypothetical protein